MIQIEKNKETIETSEIFDNIDWEYCAIADANPVSNQIGSASAGSSGRQTIDIEAIFQRRLLRQLR